MADLRFTDEVADALGHYVYRLIDPTTKQTFYVGRGVGNRVFSHVQLALRGEEGLRLERIRKIRSTGIEPEIIIHRHGLTEEAAILVEAAVIDAYPTLTNQVKGGGTDFGSTPVAEIFARYGAPPAEIRHPSILIKISQQWHDQLTPEQLYERTRRYWACNPKRKKHPPQFALAVARGLIREVYEIQAWEEYDMSKEKKDPSRRPQKAQRTTFRKGFVGPVATDKEIRSALVGRSVRHVKFGTGSPIGYALCD